MTANSEKSFMTPALSAYIKRVGAEQLNFRKFMVKIHKGKYYYERALICIDSNGDVSCSNIDYDATKDEKEAIKKELSGMQWPKAVGAPNILKLKCAKDMLFEFWDRTRNHIIMCQQRVEGANGKYYLPWTFFSDGKWRQMEPDGKLPFWKPYKARNKSKIMIHEGAKAASFIDGLVNDIKRRKELSSHPWGKELSEYEHWGMIGGALAPHRTDYAELQAEGATEVIYVCDNDFHGKEALQKVSYNYGRPIKGIKFGVEFKVGWDMADKVPENCPPLEKLKCFATYATETAQIEKGQKGRPAQVLKSYFAQEWIHCVEPDVYIHKDWPDRILTADSFDDDVRPYSGVHDTSRLIKGCGAIKSAVVKYIPALPPGLYGNNGGYFNTCRPSPIQPVEGDASPFIEFMENLLPDEEDRHQVMKWCATLIARPDIKMMYALLLISEIQGVGKGTLGNYILKPILGDSNVSSPNENDVIEGKYTYWMSHKRLAIVNEIYAGHSSVAYNKLKTLITDPIITVRRKFLADYDVDNWIHIFACSNNTNALRLTADDRRWLVPRVTDEIRDSKYWTNLHHWLDRENGLGIIVYWAHEFVRVHGHVYSSDIAPWTDTKEDIVEENHSPGEALISSICKTFKSKSKEGDEFHRCVMLDVDFVRLIKEKIYDGKISNFIERPYKIRAVARQCGWYINKTKTRLSDGTQGKLICSEKADAEKMPSQLFKEVTPTRIYLLKNRLANEDYCDEIDKVKREYLDDKRMAYARLEAEQRARGTDPMTLN